jgi:hypothetical protein
MVRETKENQDEVVLVSRSNLPYLLKSSDKVTPSALAIARKVCKRGFATGSFSSLQMVCVVTPTRRARCSWLIPAFRRSRRIAAPSAVRFFAAPISWSAFTRQFVTAPKRLLYSKSPIAVICSLELFFKT